MLYPGNNKAERALHEALEALRQDIEAAGGAAKVAVALGLSADTVSRWPNPFHKAYPTFPHLVRLLEITGGEHTLPALQKVTLRGLKAHVIDSDIAMREIEFLRNQLPRKAK